MYMIICGLIAVSQIILSSFPVIQFVRVYVYQYYNPKSANVVAGGQIVLVALFYLIIYIPGVVTGVLLLIGTCMGKLELLIIWLFHAVVVAIFVFIFLIWNPISIGLLGMFVGVAVAMPFVYMHGKEIQEKTNLLVDQPGVLSSSPEDHMYETINNYPELYSSSATPLPSSDYQFTHLSHGRPAISDEYV